MTDTEPTKPNRAGKRTSVQGPKTDFCIVGGGPAGLSLALMLLRSGCRVLLVERSQSLERTYRGEILQPGGLAVLDQIGVLDAIRARGAYQLERFQLVEGDRTLLDIDYGALAGPYAHLLSVPQRHVLEVLLEHCQAHPRFNYLAGYRASRLLGSATDVRGIRADGAGDPIEVQAQCVIGADGRYSKVRQLAGIDAARSEAFDFDVLWFKLAAPYPAGDAVQVFRAQGSPVIVHPSWQGHLQLGWTLPHQGYQRLRERGLEHVRERICQAVPPYADLIRSQVTELAQLRLLDVFAANATEWVRDGLVLIGDAAHTHGPLGAQGINLALQDSALLHPVLLEAVSQGSANALQLAGYESRRRPTVETVMRLQTIQAKAMLADRGPEAWLRPRIAGLLSRTPLGAKMARTIAYGPEPVSVRADLFQDPRPTRSHT